MRCVFEIETLVSEFELPWEIRQFRSSPVTSALD